MDSKGFTIFLVEDDPWYGQFLKHHLELNPDYTLHLFTRAQECLNKLHLQPDLICIDYSLPDMEGHQLLKKIQEHNNQLPVIVISGQEDIAVAVNLLKAGAKDYIIKDEHATDLLWRSVLNIIEKSNLQQEVAELKEQLGQKYSFENTLIGQSAAIKAIHKPIEKAIASNINVSISGETGTGKEVVAQCIHFNSDRKKMPFVAVNMAAIPKELLESELFGHEKGAFTGASHQKIGKFEQANGGTLFLDEVAEMDVNLQSKLLRALQERELVRLGGNKTIKFNARLITATHKNLAQAVKEGSFREDLYYRIVGLPVEVPPLRMRGQDILILATHFIKEYCLVNKVAPPTLTADAQKKLMQYQFPGNVRELKAIIDLAVVMSDGQQITADDIQYHQLNQDDLFASVEKTLKEYNTDIVSFFLKKYNHNVMEVARRLDIGKSTIYNMIKSGEIEYNK